MKYHCVLVVVGETDALPMDLILAIREAVPKSEIIMHLNQLREWLSGESLSAHDLGEELIDFMKWHSGFERSAALAKLTPREKEILGLGKDAV